MVFLGRFHRVFFDSSCSRHIIEIRSKVPVNFIVFLGRFHRMFVDSTCVRHISEIWSKVPKYSKSLSYLTFFFCFWFASIGSKKMCCCVLFFNYFYSYCVEYVFYSENEVHFLGFHVSEKWSLFSRVSLKSIFMLFVRLSCNFLLKNVCFFLY